MRLCSLCKKLFSDDQAVCPDDKSSTVEAALEPLPGELSERFPEREPLAQGGTGTLYLIDQPGSIENQLGPQLVLKVLAADLTEDLAERVRHRRDLRKQQGLIHPHLPPVLEEGEVDGRVWFTREYVPATSLAVRLHQSGAFGLDAAISLIAQLATALDGLHQLGLVHRDLKPGHVLLRAPQLDTAERFGLQLIDATLASPLTADNNARRGTPDYAAKELVEGAPSTFRSDLYALGCLSHELITGVPPFQRVSGERGNGSKQATLAAQRNIEPKSLPDLVPQALRSAITSMLSKDARRRPFSAQQVRRSLELVLAPVRPAARREPLSALQREAAALRLAGPTAKHQAPATYPDATVELDVKDLDEAIQASEQQAKRAAATALDDDAPTIALSTAVMPQLAAATRSGLTETQAADRSATVASNGGTNPYPSLSAQDAPRESAQLLRGDSTKRTHIPSDSSHTSSRPFDDDDAPRSTRTGTKFGIPAVPRHVVAAADEQAPQPTRTGTKFGMPAVPSSAASPSSVDVGSEGEAALEEAPRRARTGTMYGMPAVAPSAITAAAEDTDDEAAEDEEPRRPRTGTKFGLGPVRKADVEAAALAAQLQREQSPAAAPAPAAEQGSRVAKQRARRTRYTASPKALAESPRLLLWAAGGLVAFIVLVRLVFGPAERSRSPSVVVLVPEAAIELAAAEQVTAEVLSEQGLIGGDLTPVKPALPAAIELPSEAQLAAAAGAAAESAAAAPERASAATELAAAAPEQASAAAEPAIQEDAPQRKRVPTVSAVSVRGGLARNASNRQAAVSSKPVATDYKDQARELYKGRKYREAAEAYLRATKHNATDAAAFAGLGASLLATGDIVNAIAAYQSAVRLEPSVSGFQAALGRAYLTKGDRGRARAAYSKALELDPNNQAARNGMASAKAR